MASDLQVRIAAAGKIKDWDVKAAKDKIVFSDLELSPGQLEQMTRLVQTKQKNEVRCTIEPTAKRLGLKPISSVIHLDGCYVRRKGILVDVKGFTVPADRSETMVRLIREETMLTVTFEVIQGSLAFQDEKPEAGKSEDFAEDSVPQESGTEADSPFDNDSPEDIQIKCTGMKKCSVEATIHRDGEDFWLTYLIQMGNYSDQNTDEFSDQLHRSRRAALEVLRFQVNHWLDNLQFTGTADRKRADSVRRETMRQQVNDKLDELINSKALTNTADTSDAEMDDDEGDEAEA